MHVYRTSSQQPARVEVAFCLPGAGLVPPDIMHGNVYWMFAVRLRFHMTSGCQVTDYWPWMQVLQVLGHSHHEAENNPIMQGGCKYSSLFQARPRRTRARLQEGGCRSVHLGLGPLIVVVLVVLMLVSETRILSATSSLDTTAR